MYVSKLTQCPQCHDEQESHPLAKTTELAFLCKKCRRAFRKDMAVYEPEDEYCPHCDNHYVIEAKTPQLMLQVEGEDGRVDPRYVRADLCSMIRDERVKERAPSTQDGAKIDHGGYQAAAVAFQQKLASGQATNNSSHAPQAPQIPLDQLDAELDWD